MMPTIAIGTLTSESGSDSDRKKLKFWTGLEMNTIIMQYNYAFSQGTTRSNSMQIFEHKNNKK